MAVVVGRMVAVLEAQTAQFEARMNAAGQQLNRWNTAGAQARRGTQLLKTGFQQLAFEGLGVMPPALARVSAGMLTLVGPGGVLLAAVAVLGVLSLAFERAGKKAQEFVEEANRVREFRLEHLKMLGGLGGEIQLTPSEQLRDMQKRRADAAREIAARRELLPSGLMGQLLPPTARQKEIAQEIEALTNSLNNFDRAIRVLRADIQEAAARAAELAAIRAAAIAKLDAMGISPSLNRLRLVNPRDIRPSGSVTPPGFEPDKFKLTPEFGIMAGMALLQGAQGGPASLFGAAAGPLAMINPLAGAISAGIGGIFGLFDSAEERRHRQLVDTIKKLGQEVGLERVTVVFTGPDGHQIRKSLAELEEGDAVERVPGPVGAGG